MPQRPSRKQVTFGSHNRSWIWGRHVVLETLRSGRWRPLALLISPRCADDVRSEVVCLVQQQGLELQETTDPQLARRCRSEDHQGLAAALPPFPYADFDDLLARQPIASTWLLLDRLQDSFNFGAVLRAALGLGVDAVVVSAAEQSDVNSQVVRSSAGAACHLPVARVERLVDAVKTLRARGCAVIAALEKAEQSVDQIDLQGPVAMVIGNEGRGIQPEVLRECSAHVRIPMTGRIGSLNAAVAAGILCYEIMRQRRLKEPRTK
jgi:23S rRNA (guanosine2251-2'-O)-methyltransferase